jgi:hypothetical protein
MKQILFLSLLAAPLFGQATTNGDHRFAGGVTANGGVNAGGAETGAANAYVFPVTPAPLSYVTNACYTFRAANANTGASTVNIGGLGVKPIKKAAGGVTTDLAASDIRAGQTATLCYDGTNFQMQSTLGNAPSGGGGGGSTGLEGLSGVTVPTTTGWAFVSGGSPAAGNTAAGIAVDMSTATAGAQQSWYYRAQPATPYAVTIALRCLDKNNCGAGFDNAGHTSAETLTFWSSSGTSTGTRGTAVFVWNETTGAVTSTSTEGVDTMNGIHWVCLVNDGTNISFKTAPSGYADPGAAKNWFTYFSEPKGDHIVGGPANIVITGTNAIVHVFDYTAGASCGH